MKDTTLPPTRITRTVKDLIVKKAAEKKFTISDYIRDLIEKDLTNNNGRR